MSPFDRYLTLRLRFAVSRALAVEALARAEPLARRALGAHAGRDRLGMGEELQVYPVLTSPAENGGWGELMPVWFKPYERPLPIYVLDNWAMVALAWGDWMGEIGPAFNIENLARVLLGSSLLIPFLPATQRGSHFLRHGALTVLLGLLWLPAPEREPLLAGLAAGGQRFAKQHRLAQQADLAGHVGWLEAQAFLMAEGRKISGEAGIRNFLANAEQFEAYAALFGGLCFSVSALYRWYGPAWEEWVFQAVNVHYRYAHFGLEAWGKWLEESEH